MIVVDSSIWIEHFRRALPDLKDFLEEDRVLTHPFIIGELALGNLKFRAEVISLLSILPFVKLATADEVLHLIEKKKLFGRGVGLVDVHLIASALLSKATIWTGEKSLRKVCEDLDIPLQ